MAISDELGTAKSVWLSRAKIEYRERGAGPPVVFVHGLLVNADIWRKVVPAVAEAGNRCIAPDWPLGAHSTAVPGVDLSPPALADMIAEFLDTLDIRDATIVANDTGGALVQLLMVQRPDRIARVVLTPSDCFESFFPPVFAPLPKLARVPGFLWLLVQAARLRLVQRSPLAFGWVAKRPLDKDIVESYIAPSRRLEIRDDLRRFLLTVHNRHTLAAAERFGEFDKPVLLAWAEEDKLFPIKLAHRLVEALPNASLTAVADSYTFIPEDQPAKLAELITWFIAAELAAH
ncbi:alpha/beta fold hydrolase [Actinocrispum wychmicini]|uniref:Pimeloyl-ACP methyl ester carboxylesterase n=1 Tax=Actinocrispum wychmicini TaxID=1213861 RepID=A0A4R2JGH2_9PSEU|nr:alpha/beta hydrolase [Actinocrispum wychmicini]TCO58124.1 pimeloyl-ACP methyl ester carboxylesterase [Actinocrispum wychmicini]